MNHSMPGLPVNRYRKVLLVRVIRESSGGGRQNPEQLTRSEKPWEKATAIAGAPGAEDWGVQKLVGWKTKIVCLPSTAIKLKGKNPPQESRLWTPMTEPSQLSHLLTEYLNCLITKLEIKTYLPCRVFIIIKWGNYISAQPCLVCSQ